MVKPGLRSQILLLLGLVLCMAFAPLYFAISTYTEVALERTQHQAAADFAESTARWVETSSSGGLAELQAAFPDDSSVYSVQVIGVFGGKGEQHKRIGRPDRLSALPERFPGALQADTEGPNGLAELLLCKTGSSRNVCVLVQYPHGDAAPLNRLVGLYMALIAVALLGGMYFSVTGMIIRPLDKVARAAERVASAKQRLELPSARSRELSDLVQSLRRMTDVLASEQSALRTKVEELEHARGQLEATQKQLVRSERLASVGQLSAGLAHEIGNPLAAMQGMADLMIDGGLDEEQRADFTRRLRNETERISRIIRDLLDFARPATEQEGEMSPGNVEAAINETITLITPQPVMRNVELAVDVYPDLPAVRLGHGRVVQVVLNLVLNAATAFAKEGGTVNVSARLVNGLVELRVEDDGPGVKPELQETLFEPFVTSKEVGEGTGLGLSVCKGLVEAAGGSIQLDQSGQRERGACFVVLLPPVSSAGSRKPAL